MKLVKEISVNFKDEEVNLQLNDKQSNQNSQKLATLNDDDGTKNIPQLRENRESWGNNAEFILAVIGLTVGLGNICRLSYLLQKNGGGVFLIPYIIFLIIEGVPLLLMELGTGQIFQKSAVKIWHDIHPSLMGIGVGSMVVSFLHALYYIIGVTWGTYYLYESFTKRLPWTKNKCPKYQQYMFLQKKPKNTTYYESLHITSSKNLSASLKIEANTFPDCCIYDAPKWFWYNKVLRVSESIETGGIDLVPHLALCLLLSWIVVYFCLMKGVKIGGKVVYLTAILPFVVMVILFFRGVTLPGGIDGIKVYLTFQWKFLLNCQIWMDAATQVLFSLKLGLGTLTVFASYNPTRNNIIGDSYRFVFLNCVTVLFAGMMFFAILGHHKHITGISIAEVGSGSGLAFISFYDAMLSMDISPWWAILFLVMLILLGIHSEFGTMETIVASLYDMKLIKMKRPMVTAICVIVMFLVGLPMVSGHGYYIFQIFDEYLVTVLVPVITLCQTLAWAWIYGSDRLARDIEFKTGIKTCLFWRICWKYLSPLALFLILIWKLVQIGRKMITYSAYVGCIQDPYNISRHPGSNTWMAKFPYPAWIPILAVVIILVCFLLIAIYAIKDRCKMYELVDERLAKMETSLAETNENLAETNENLAETNKNLAETNENLAETNENLAETNENLADVRRSVTEVNESIDEHKGKHITWTNIVSEMSKSMKFKNETDS